jgi:hypothetical protein
MQKHIEDQPHLTSRPIHEDAQVRTKPRWLQLCHVGFLLLIAFTVTTFIQSRPSYAAFSNKTAIPPMQGVVVLSNSNGTMQLMTIAHFDPTISQSHSSLIIMVHNGLCSAKAPAYFMTPATPILNLSAISQSFKENVKKQALPLTLPTTPLSVMFHSVTSTGTAGPPLTCVDFVPSSDKTFLVAYLGKVTINSTSK